MNKLKVLEKVRELAEVVVRNKGLELVHIEIVGSGKNRTIRIFIDNEDGITHDHCSAVSLEIERFLDENDFISTSYLLEVSSPGIERGLYKLADFERFSNEAAKIKTLTAIGNQKNFRGTIIGIDGEEIVFDDRTNGELNIPHSIVRRANLEFDIERELRKAKGDKKS